MTKQILNGGEEEGNAKHYATRIVKNKHSSSSRAKGPPIKNPLKLFCFMLTVHHPKIRRHYNEKHKTV